MKFTKLKDTVAKISAFLGISEIPINAETKTTNFSEEQMTKLKESFGDGFCESMVSAMNTEIKAFLNENLELKAMEDEIKAILAAQEAKVESEENPDMDKPNALTPTLELSGKEALTQLEAKLEEKDALIARLIKEPEDDVQTQNAQAVKKFDLKHSATHLFASSKQYDAFDKRPWNVRMRDQGIKATDFNADGSIPLLQDDVEHFVRENPEALNSLFNEHYKLPADWDYRTGVLDRTSEGFIIPGEVVQGRSKGWSPKGDFLIKAEEGRVYPKKIDITFKGYELQQIENTWVRSYNKDGSHPWKMSFIYFLLSELVKQQAADDANAQINGIYVENPGGDNNPGAAVNSQNGLLFLYWWFRDVKKQYRPAKLGRPTPENIVDYVKKLVLSIPEKDRRQQGLELQITETIMGWYRERAGFLYQHNYNTDTGKYEYKGNHVIDYPNIKFQVIPNMTNTEFMAIVSSKNVQVMDYNTNEKGKFTITHTRRDTDIFADYRLGIRLKFVGNKIKETDPRQFEIQKIWSNDVPIFPADTNVPIYDDTTGNLKVVYPSVRVDEKWKTDIEDIEGIIPGQIVKIYGNKGLAAAKKVKKNTKFNLKSDYELNTDGCLTMVVLADKTLKELNRTSSAPIVNPVREFNSDVLDVTGASQFEYTGEESVVLAEIINSSEGNAVKIFGTNTENVTVTIQANETISVDTTAVLASKAHYIVLINVDGIWYELERKTE